MEFGEAAYALDLFCPAPDKQGVERAGPSSLVNIVYVPDPLESIDDLDEWEVGNRIKIICQQGHDPDKPKEGDDSRSAWLFDAVCNLVRCGVPDEVILSVITDPELRISESVLEKGRNARKYAIRQIQRAHEYAINPWLMKLNEKHAVIGNIGGKCRVIQEVYDPIMDRTRLTKQSFPDFRNRYMHIKVEVGTNEKTGLPILMPVGKWWLENKNRREYEDVVFAPNRDIPGSYNLWQGFAYDAIPGDFSLFLDHVRENVCAGDETTFEYLIGWMASAVQRPDTQGHAAVVLRGGRGTGKSFFAKQFGALFGRHFLQVSDAKYLVGHFNAHLRDCVLLFADEAFYAGDKKHESVLKTLITEETLVIEGKGVDAEVASNFIHLILASNSDWVVPTGYDERRFLVLDVGEAKKQDHTDFAAIDAQMKNGGREGLLHYLLNYDLSGFNVREIPETEALMDQKMQSMPTLDEWIMTLLHDGELPGAEYGKPNVAP